MKKENKKAAHKARKKANIKKQTWEWVQIIGMLVGFVALMAVIIIDPFATKPREITVPEVHLFSNKLLEIESGDDVNFHFTSYIDGVEYEKADDENGGKTITIGKDDSDFPADFDDLFIGKHPTENFKYTTTYPADYAADANLAGKEVVYDITINGIFSYDHLEYQTDSSYTIEKGNKVNIDYVGYVDGTAFAGGDTKLQGTDLEIGSGTYIDNFEEQLIGAHPRDEVKVTVTFPDPYQNNPALAGKEAVFEVYINGVYN